MTRIHRKCERVRKEGRRSTWAEALTNGEGIEWEFDQAKIDFRSHLGKKDLPGVTKSRYQVATIRSLVALATSGETPLAFTQRGARRGATRKLRSLGSSKDTVRTTSW